MSKDGFRFLEGFSRLFLFLQIVTELSFINGSSQQIAPDFLYKRGLVMEGGQETHLETVF